MSAISLARAGLEGGLKVNAEFGRRRTPRFFPGDHVDIAYFWGSGLQTGSFSLRQRCRPARQAGFREPGDDLLRSRREGFDHGPRNDGDLERAPGRINLDLVAELAHEQGKSLLKAKATLLRQPIEMTAIQAAPPSVRPLGRIHADRMDMKLWFLGAAQIVGEHGHGKTGLAG